MAADLMTRINQWEQAWSDYVDALSLDDTVSEIGGEDFVHWCGVAGRRVAEAKSRLRQLDPEFCKALGIN